MWPPAWSGRRSGGDITFIEATRMAGNKRLILTGKLGDVMKESAQAAVSYVRSKANDLGIDEEIFAKSDLHIHVPAGAVPKDGPSAGVTMATALVSLLTERSVRADVAMTGEITLRGQVLPVGGIKQKVLGASRVGIDTVILPQRNEPDLEDIPEEIRDKMNFVFAERVDDVFAAALRRRDQSQTDPVVARIEGESKDADIEIEEVIYRRRLSTGYWAIDYSLRSSQWQKKKKKMQWYKMDLHLHTPASADWQEPGVSYLDLLHKAEMQGLDILAITDHNTVAGCAALQEEIEQLQLLERLGRIHPEEKRQLDEFRRIGNKILVLPGL